MKESLKHWLGRFPDMGAVLSRFPVPVMCMAVFTCLFIIFKDKLNNNDYEIIGRLLLGLILAAYLAVSMTLAGEGREKGRNLAMQAGAVLGICALAWVSKGLKFNLFMAVGASVLILGNSILWRRPRNDLHVWDFTHKLWTGAGFAVAGSIIFTVGLFAISAALESLFGINLNFLVEDLLLPIGLGLLAPIYWLATLPPVDEDYSELYDNPGFVSKAVAFMGTWLLSPLTLIYALILLAYGIKIVIAGELPKGEIAQLTTPFLLVGTVSWLVLAPPFAKDKWLARLFQQFWWPLSVPAALMLLTAVFVRVGEYGFTPQRLLLLGVVIWSLGLALWFIFGPKAKRDIRLIPGAAAGLLFFGAISAGWLSHFNQGARFEKNLIASGIMDGGGKVSASPDITDMAAAVRAKGALMYLLSEDGHAKAATILAGSTAEFDAETEDTTALYKRLGLNDVVLPSQHNSSEQTYYQRDASQPMSLANFDKIFGSHRLFIGNGNHNDAVQTFFTHGSLRVTYTGNHAIFKTDAHEIVFDFKDWLDDQKFGFGEINQALAPITILETETQEIAVVIDSFHLSGPPDDDRSYFNLSFYTLTRGIN